ncbi:MAG: HAD family hydrolase [Clostridia bacterium]
MQNIHGAIFDFDGTLIDSMWAWATVASRYLSAQGITPKADIDTRIFRMSLADASELIRREYHLTQRPEEIQEGMNALVRGMYQHTFQLKPGVPELLEELNRRGVKCCLATASDRDVVEPALRRTGIYDDLDFIFTCSELHTDKNTPYIYNYVRSYMQTPREETLIFEDAYHAIRVAKDAGFAVAAVYDAAEEENQPVIRELADYYLRTPAEWPKLFPTEHSAL